MSMRSTRKNPTDSLGFSPQKRFRCGTCQRHFSRREHLQRHERIHDNNKPFHCELCPYSCRRKDLLNRHNRLSHSSPSTDGVSRPPADDGAPESANDRQLQQCLIDYNRMNAGSDTNRYPTIVQDAMGAPPILEQPGMNDMPQYTSPVEDPSSALPTDVQPFLNADQNMQPFTFDFLDNVCLPPLPAQTLFYPDLSIVDPPSVSPVIDIGRPFSSRATSIPTHSPGTLARIESHIPESPTEPGSQHVHVAPILRVSQDDWHWLSIEIGRFSSVLPEDYALPSRHAFSRYLHGFMSGFHPHFPIIHPQTISFRGTAPELVLALAAVGSNYCFESHQGLKLFRIARSIALEQTRRRDTDKGDQPQTAVDSELCNDYRYVETIQALFYLMAMATWGGEDRSLVRQALATQSVLAMLVRQHGLSESPEVPSIWHEWARAESARRTKLIVFCFFNLHSITFNLPSPLLVTDIHLRLPCPELEWRAPDSESWASIHERSCRPQFFQECLATLLRDGDTTPACSSLGSHALIHALLQRIISIQQSIHLEGLESEIPSGLSTTLRRALKKWQRGWERNPESSYSPLAKHGPIAFNSNALAHLAYIRLAVDIGPARSLLDSSHAHIAKRLSDQPKLQRGPLLLLAAKHATAALCAPVQMGVHFVGRAPSWSVMHAVCSLEYAYILNQFIQATTAQNLECPLESDEQALLQTIKETLREVESSTPSGDPGVIETAPQLLGAKAVRAWAMILQGMRTWNAVNVITQVLFEYAGLLQSNIVGETNA